jgi:hypothetical protein
MERVIGTNPVNRGVSFVLHPASRSRPSTRIGDHARKSNRKPDEGTDPSVADDAFPRASAPHQGKRW